MGKVFNALQKHKQGKLQGANRVVRRDITLPLSQSPIAEGVPIHNVANPKLFVLAAPESIDAENFKVLRSQILYPKHGRKPRTIIITSAFPGEGKTFVAANLAASIAMGINEQVLLVDCDFRRPNLHNMFGCSNIQGLYEYLTAKRTLPELILPTEMEKLHLLTAGKPGPDGAELLSSTKMKAFLEEVKARHNETYVIVDAAPSHVTAEVGVLSNHVDGIVYIVMAERAPKETIQKSIEDLGKDKILGIVFNGYAQSYRTYHKYYGEYYG
ncbi:MAG: polysaccharide biosynthesis tyrosine autokinase [Thermodesulfobacteriota bacterium]|nr:polysaccharide biosynthesis tyrosine autokinase [Thermodesulfobacteriota bacterium]